ncbi:MAG: NADH-quinone oxidoreductase subunit H [Spirochaetes bacterium]|nr:NADH-quinone oxidoreductase subunit H [Spirochaetota bacterium]
MGWFQTLCHVVAALALPPLVLGIINKTKAAFAGKVGPPVLQLYYDLFKLVQKRMVVSRTTSWVFFAGPVGAVVVGVLVSLLVPLGDHRAPVSFAGDMVLLVALLGLSRFLTVGAALDTGSPFEGMGAAREVTFAALAEPGLFLGLCALVVLSGQAALAPMLAAASQAWGAQAGTLALVLLGWFIVLLVENCRIPFDDPNTHLELTMIHEVMILDHSGPLLAMALYGASMKLFLLISLLLALCLPRTGNAPLDWGLFLAGVGAAAVLVGVVESVIARLRLPRIPLLLVSAALFTGFAFLLSLVKR